MELSVTDLFARDSSKYAAASASTSLKRARHLFGSGDAAVVPAVEPFKQVVVAAADGCIAAMSIDKYLKGRKSVKVDWIHK